MTENTKDSLIGSLEEKVTHLSRMLVKSFGYADQDPDTFLQNARRTTEAICRFIYIKEIGEPKSKMMLNDYGRELLTKKIIPDRIGILIGTIQTYGNYAAHAQDDLSETTREWISPCQTALASLTNWFFLEYLKGNVPNELVTPVQNYAETQAVQATQMNRKKARTSFVLVLTIAVVVILIGGITFYLNFKSNQKVQAPPVDKTVTATDNVVKQQDEVVNKLNETTPNPNAKRIAVIYFDNGSDNKELSRLRKGLADMLISDLTKIKMLNVVERTRLEEILKEQKLNNSKEFDASTATKVGKLLGVEYILTGSFFDLMGSLRIDARIINVETGKIIKSDGVDGGTATFFDLEKKLVVKIASGLNVDMSVINTESSATAGTKTKESLSYETSLLFSDGLEQMDKGETSKAIETFKKVLQKNPDFAPAQQALNKLSVKI
jgi:TolB-like protein